LLATAIAVFLGTVRPGFARLQVEGFGRSRLPVAGSWMADMSSPAPVAERGQPTDELIV
jgi:hypothetical protein